VLFAYFTFACSEAIAFLMMSVALWRELVLLADECFWLFQGGEMTPFSPTELPVLLPR
jgi:cytochrome b subunit of formate dehydrogenase